MARATPAIAYCMQARYGSDLNAVSCGFTEIQRLLNKVRVIQLDETGRRNESRADGHEGPAMPTPRHAMSSLPTLAHPATRQQKKRQGEGGGRADGLTVWWNLPPPQVQQPTSGSWTLAPQENFSPVQPWPMTMVTTTAATAATGWANPWVMEKRNETSWPSICFGVGRRPALGQHHHFCVWLWKLQCRAVSHLFPT